MAAKRRKRASRVIPIVGVLVAVGGVAVFAMRPVRVTTTNVVVGTAVDAVYATGTIEPVERLTIRAKVGGVLERFTLHEGDAVKEGDVLARIDSSEMKAIRAQVRATDAELANARDELSRSERLNASASTGEAEVERWRMRVARLEAEHAAQEARLGSLRGDHAAADGKESSRTDDGDVRSPLTGMVLARHVEPGEVIAPNQPLFRIGTADKLRLECAVDEADVGRIVPGRAVAISLYAFADRAFRGRVTEIFPDADRARKTFLVKINVEDPPPGLRSGMSAEANIIIDEHPRAVLAPASAVDARGEVWLVRDGRAEKRTVRVGIRDLLRVEVLEGLREGDEVVTAGAASLSAGARVGATLVKTEVNMAAPHKGGSGS